MDQRIKLDYTLSTAQERADYISNLPKEFLENKAVKILQKD